MYYNHTYITVQINVFNVSLYRPYIYIYVMLLIVRAQFIYLRFEIIKKSKRGIKKWEALAYTKNDSGYPLSTKSSYYTRICFFV